MPLHPHPCSIAVVVFALGAIVASVLVVIETSNLVAWLGERGSPTAQAPSGKPSPGHVSAFVSPTGVRVHVHRT